MKKRKVLTNGYTSRKRRREVLGFGVPREDWFKDAKGKSQIKNDPIFECKCGRSIYDHPDLLVGCHYRSMPYYGDLCPFVTIGEIKSQ
jgi:hypothetical protein